MTQEQTGIPGVSAKYAVIYGLASFAIFLTTVFLDISQILITLASVALLVVVIVLAHRDFKRGRKGFMSWGQGFGIGALVAVISAVLSSVLTFVYVRFINPGHLAGERAAQEVALRDQGMSQAQIDQAMAVVNVVATPGGTLILGLVLGVLVGCLVALIVPIFTKKEPLIGYGGS